MNDEYCDNSQYNHEELELLKEHVEIIYDHISDHLKNLKFWLWNNKEGQQQQVTIILPKDDHEYLVRCYVDWDMMVNNDENPPVLLDNAKPLILIIPKYVWGDYKTWEDRHKPLHTLSRSGMVDFVRPLFAEYNIKCEELNPQAMEWYGIKNGGCKI
jgi:hypothetical protein